MQGVHELDRMSSSSTTPLMLSAPSSSPSAPPHTAKSSNNSRNKPPLLWLSMTFVLILCFSLLHLSTWVLIDQANETEGIVAKSLSTNMHLGQVSRLRGITNFGRSWRFITRDVEQGSQQRLGGHLRPMVAKISDLPASIDKEEGKVIVSLPNFLDCSYPFVKDTMVNRCPENILKRTIEYNKDKLTGEQVASLRSIATEMKENLALSPIVDGGPDMEQWNQVLRGYLDKDARWWDVPWLVWETYLYRRMLQATGYWESNLDLFAVEKDDGLKAFEELLKERSKITLDLGNEWKWESFFTVLMLDLWGNQADASLFTPKDIGQKGKSNSADNMLVDDSGKVWDSLNSETSSKERRVVFFNDNAGLEIFSDLCLSHYLLKSGQVGSVEFKLKPYPFFVSDATPNDVSKTINFLKSMESQASKRLGCDLEELIEQGKLILSTEMFLTSGQPMWEMPDALRTELKSNADKTLVIVKGDLMYRKLLGDFDFETSMSFQDLMSYFPCPVVSLRTLKSPVAVGLSHGQAEILEKQDPNWMISGKHGTVQFAKPAPVVKVESVSKSPNGDIEEDSAGAQMKLADGFIVTLVA
mmetsp:Transcript_31281/g.76301  ORF Transcript_31281/g.76301 Transcript_31281/m.76301 type:complete len:585 (-) Transcript_31281:41-1795(-)